MVARCQGGNNAGHTVVADSVSYAFHLLPSGLVHPNAKAVLGKFLDFFEERQSESVNILFHFGRKWCCHTHRGVLE